MNQTITPIPTASALEREWRMLGFVEGAPAHLDSAIVADDVRSYRRMACGSCGHRSQTVSPFRRGREYRLLCRCRKCGHGVEA
ncbi:MAG TPA: hypothetical protein VH643_03420 [Gemmataceae bacterium]|jgi:hypothetical protein